MSQPAGKVNSLQDIGKLFDAVSYEEAVEENSADRALDGLREGEQAKLVSLLGTKAVRQKIESIGIRYHLLGVGNYAVLVGTEEAWERTYEERVKAYYTLAWWDAGRGKWKEKKRPKQKKYPGRWRPFSFRDRERTGLYDESPWPEFFDPFDHDADLMLELKWEKLVARYKTGASIVTHAEPEMLARWGVIEGDDGEELFEDLKSGYQWKPGVLGPVYVPGRHSEPKVAFVRAHRPRT